MRVHAIVAVALCAVAACTSAEEKQRQRDEAMIEAAKADAADESTFVADSLALLKSIVMDTVTDLQVRIVDGSSDDTDTQLVTQYVAVSPRGNRCLVDSLKYHALVRGDTLSCQWGPPE
jgi:hypothetical protein